MPDQFQCSLSLIQTALNMKVLILLCIVLCDVIYKIVLVKFLKIKNTKNENKNKYFEHC